MIALPDILSSTPLTPADALETALAFHRAIHTMVSQGDVVLIAGTAVGSLAGFAIAAGAARVHVVEFDPVLASRLRLQIAVAERDDDVTVSSDEMSAAELLRATDVVVTDVLDHERAARWLMPLLARLAGRGVITEQTRLIPFRYEVDVELTGRTSPAEFAAPDARQLVSTSSCDIASRPRILTDRAALVAAHPTRWARPHAAHRINFRAHVDGLATGVRFTRRSWLSRDIALAPDSLPVEGELLQLPQPIPVVRGAFITCRVGWIAGTHVPIRCWGGD